MMITSSACPLRFLPRGTRMAPVSRRRFLQTAGAVAGGLATPVAASARDQSPQRPPGPRKFRLGIVTYNIAAAWDVPTILKVCKNVSLSPVELRTTHKHGVEPSLSKEA